MRVRAGQVLVVNQAIVGGVAVAAGEEVATVFRWISVPRASDLVVPDRLLDLKAIRVRTGKWAKTAGFWCACTQVLPISVIYMSEFIG